MHAPYGHTAVFSCWVCLPENAAKVRMALVRGHSLALVNLLQSRAQHTTGRMQEWLEEHCLAEMKRYGAVWQRGSLLLIDNSSVFVFQL